MLPAVAAIAAALAVFAAVLAGAGRVAPEGRAWRRRAAALDRRTAPMGAGGATSGVALRELQLSGSQQANAILQRFQWAPREAHALERADLPLKVSEYLLLQLGAFIAVTVLVMLISGLWLVGLGFGVGAVVFVRLWVSRRAAKRLSLFNKQLPVALHTMATSLRSGFSIMESIRTVAHEMDHPLSTEFRRILDETRLGSSFEESMNRMSDRVESEDLHVVTRALDIHRRVGGDLAAILESVAKTMREREELRGHVIAMTAQQRFGGMIVGLLPLWVIAFFAATAPDFVAPLWEEPLGRVFLVTGALMEIVAFFVMRQVLKIEV